MPHDLKQGIVTRLKQVGAYDVGIADPRSGFDHALPDKHPHDLWEESKSIVVFVVACPPKTNNTYIGTYAPWEGNRRIGPVPVSLQSDLFAMQRLITLIRDSITLKGMEFLKSNEYKAVLPRAQQGIGVYNVDKIPGFYGSPSLKLSAVEAGLGVYGRSGLVIHPVLGNRFRIGAILTDAVLEPDNRLEGFMPCEDCVLCAEVCPVNAHDVNKPYPRSFDREKCMSYRAGIAEQGLYCHNCFAVCPLGTFDDEELCSIKDAESIFKT